MPIYTVKYCDEYLDELTDKLGSDYFPLSVKFGRVVTAVYDFIRANTKYIETTQEISDDIKPLLVKTNFAMLPGSEPGYYEIAEPLNYLRLISVEPYAKVNGLNVKKFKNVKIVKEGQRITFERDPHNKATPEYPHVYRNTNIFEINIGYDLDVYETAKVSYIKKPTFGDINDDDAILVNLPDIAMEKILLKVAESLRFTTADENAASIYQFDETFGKINK